MTSQAAQIAPGLATANADWWRGGVIYQIYPRSFQDSNGDGIGDLKGITSRLDYIESLGVDAIWISPFFKSPMKDFGYDVSDYRDVDPMFGTLADFDELLDKAHARGLRVMIDLVLSTPPISTSGSVKAARAATILNLTGLSGPIPARMARRPTTGSRSLGVLPGSGTRGGNNIICTTFLLLSQT